MDIFNRHLSGLCVANLEAISCHHILYESWHGKRWNLTFNHIYVEIWTRSIIDGSNEIWFVNGKHCICYVYKHLIFDEVCIYFMNICPISATCLPRLLRVCLVYWLFNKSVFQKCETQGRQLQKMIMTCISNIKKILLLKCMRKKKRSDSV